jgi:hypothetical protein
MNHLNKPRLSNKRIVPALFFMTLMLACMAVASAQKRPILGGYSKAEIDNAGVVEAAEWAVGEQGRKQEVTVTLESIERAATQSATGRNFKLCLKVRLSAEGEDEESEQLVRVVVHKSFQNVFTLSSWAEVENCGSEEDENWEE